MLQITEDEIKKELKNYINAAATKYSPNIASKSDYEIIQEYNRMKAEVKSFMKQKYSIDNIDRHKIASIFTVATILHPPIKNTIINTYNAKNVNYIIAFRIGLFIITSYLKKDKKYDKEILKKFSDRYTKDFIKLLHSNIHILEISKTDNTYITLIFFLSHIYYFIENELISEPKPI